MTDNALFNLEGTDQAVPGNNTLRTTQYLEEESSTGKYIRDCESGYVPKKDVEAKYGPIAQLARAHD